MPQQNDYCSYCGVKYEDLIYPRKCQACQEMVWQNPKPVVVVSIVVEHYASRPTWKDILLIKRENVPCVGEWALPGGHLEQNETWQECAARELEEETGLIIPAEWFNLTDVLSSHSSNNLLIFGETKIYDMDDRINFKDWKFQPNLEVSEVKFVQKKEHLAFETHTQILASLLHRYHIDREYQKGYGY